MRIGKKQISAVMTSLGAAPNPNATTSAGAIATSGVTLSTTAIGMIARRASGTSLISTARANAAAKPMASHPAASPSAIAPLRRQYGPLAASDKPLFPQAGRGASAYPQGHTVNAREPVVHGGAGRAPPERPHDRPPLLHPARQLGGQFVRDISESDLAQQLTGVGPECGGKTAGLAGAAGKINEPLPGPSGAAGGPLPHGPGLSQPAAPPALPGPPDGIH